MGLGDVLRLFQTDLFLLHLTRAPGRVHDGSTSEHLQTTSFGTMEHDDCE